MERNRYQTGSLWGLPFRRKELRTFACFPLHKRQADLLRASAGGYCVWLKIQVRGKRGDAENFYKRAFCHIFLLSFALTYSILLSTIFDGPPLSPERETCCMLLFVQLSHSCLLSRGSSSTCYRYSYTLTYSILLSSIRQQRSSRDEWVLPDSKMAPELYKIVRPGAIFLFGIS